jgi:hypothetical protein
MNKRRISHALAFVTVAALSVAGVNGCIERERSYPFELLEKVPLSSSTEPMDILSRDNKLFSSDLELWIKTETPGVRVIDTPFGRFKRELVGDFNWQKVPKVFTGRIRFRIEREFMDDIVLVFDYIDGILRKKDWGYGIG